MKTYITKPRTKLAWKILGYAGVDSGQILICDPCYLPNGSGESEWQSKEMSRLRIYRDTAGRRFCYCWGAAVTPSGTQPFNAYDQPIPGAGGKTANELIASKAWAEEPDPEPSGDFSYAGCCEATLSNAQFGQLNFRRGHGGAGVVASTAHGDGHYPVYGLFRGTDRRPLAMIVVTDDVESLPKLPA